MEILILDSYFKKETQNKRSQKKGNEFQLEHGLNLLNFTHFNLKTKEIFFCRNDKNKTSENNKNNLQDGYLNTAYVGGSSNYSKTDFNKTLSENEYVIL